MINNFEHAEIISKIRNNMLSIRDFRSAIRRGFNYIGSVDENYTENALWACCSCGNATILKEIIKLKPDLNKSFVGICDTPLIACLDSGKNVGKIIEILVRAGANINGRSYVGDTALVCATCGNSIAAAKALIKYGANVDIIDRSRNAPIELAMQFDRVIIFKELLKCQPKILVKRISTSIKDKYRSQPGMSPEKETMIMMLVDYLIEKGEFDTLKEMIGRNLKESVNYNKIITKYEAGLINNKVIINKKNQKIMKI